MSIKGTSAVVGGRGQGTRYDRFRELGAHARGHGEGRSAGLGYLDRDLVAAEEETGRSTLSRVLMLTLEEGWQVAWAIT